LLILSSDITKLDKNNYIQRDQSSIKSLQKKAKKKEEKEENFYLLLF
jgi:hypothetical protein